MSSGSRVDAGNRQMLDEEQNQGKLKRSTSPDIPRRVTSMNMKINPEEGLSRSQVLAMRAVESTLVKVFMGSIILINSAQVLYEADNGALCRFENNLTACTNESGWLRTINVCYLGIYTIELAVRIYVHRSGCFIDPWDMFDAFIIITGVISEAFGGLLPSTGILRLTRLCRLAKAFRMLQLPSELHIMIHGFLSALMAISMGAVLVFVMLTLWSVVAVELLNGLAHDQELVVWWDEQKCDRCPKAWSSVANAIFSFTQLMIMGESWDLLAIPIVERYPAALMLFVLVFFTVVLGMTNLILAVIVDKALKVHDDNHRHQAEKKEKERGKALDSFLAMCRAMDTSEDGVLDLEELINGFDTIPQFRDVLDVMDINQHELEVLFHIMDRDGSGDVSYVEFAAELAKVKNSSVQTMMSFTKYHVVRTRMMVEEIASTVLSVDKCREIMSRNNYCVGHLRLEEDTDFPNAQNADVCDGSPIPKAVFAGESSGGQRYAVDKCGLSAGHACAKEFPGYHEFHELKALLATLRMQAQEVRLQAQSVTESTCRDALARGLQAFCINIDLLLNGRVLGQAMDVAGLANGGGSGSSRRTGEHATSLEDLELCFPTGVEGDSSLEAASALVLSPRRPVHPSIVFAQRARKPKKSVQ